MKVLIIYATKGGLSRRAAEMLCENISKHAEISLFDINDNPPSPEGFDIAVIGGSIRFGRLNSKLKNYIKAYKAQLSSINSAAFICCGYSNNFDDYRVMQLPKDLHCSLGIHYFGGELKPDKLRGFDKLFVKLVRENILSQDPDISDSDRNELPEIMPDTVYALAQRICKLSLS